MEVDCYLKMVQQVVTPTNYDIARPTLTVYCTRPLALWRFSQLFLLNISKDQTLSHNAGPLALSHSMVNPALVITLRP